MEITEKVVQQVWEKAIVFAPETKNDWRKDVQFSFIKRSDFNNFDSEYGWVIDLIDISGRVEIENFRPMQWRNIKRSNIQTQNKSVILEKGLRN